MVRMPDKVGQVKLCASISSGEVELTSPQLLADDHSPPPKRASAKIRQLARQAIEDHEAGRSEPFPE